MASQSDRKQKNALKVFGYIVGVISVIIAVIALFYGENLCQQTNPPPWIRPALNTVCPAKPTPSPSPTTRVDECGQPGDDWNCNCISSVNWQTFSEPSESFIQNNCWDLDPWGIAAEQGNLLIVMERNRDSIFQEEYTRRGILTPLPFSATISLDLMITNLSTNYVDQLTNLTIGIIPSNPIDPVSGISLIYQRESTDSPIAIKLHERGSLQEYVPLSYSLGQRHHIEIRTTAVSASIYVDGRLAVGPEPLPPSPALWIGYLMPRSGEVNASISSLSVVTE
ncbi:MAG: hypothetical protein ABIJ39_00320 [Chloroflexota bacterium]